MLIKTVYRKSVLERKYVVILNPDFKYRKQNIIFPLKLSTGKSLKQKSLIKNKKNCSMLRNRLEQNNLLCSKLGKTFQRQYFMLRS